VSPPAVARRRRWPGPCVARRGRPASARRSEGRADGAWPQLAPDGSPADQGAGERGGGPVDAGAARAAGCQAAARFQPRRRAPGARGAPPEPLLRPDADARDAAADPAAPQVAAAPVEVVALVRVELAGAAPRPPPRSTDGRDGLQQRLRDQAVV